jgi:hypothetical protein
MTQTCIDTISTSDQSHRAFLWGALGAVGFSFSLPARRLAVAEWCWPSVALTQRAGVDTIEPS